MVDPETYDPILLTLTGAIVTWWGRIEGLMFHDLLSLQHDNAVKASGVCDPLPIATKNLIKAWTKATRLVEMEDSWRAELERVAVELRECVEDRHAIVHGFWDYPDPEKSDRTKITVIKPTKDNTAILFEQHDVDVKKLIEIETRFRSLYHRLLPFSLNHGFRLGPKISPRAASSATEVNPDAPPQAQTRGSEPGPSDDRE